MLSLLTNNLFFRLPARQVPKSLYLLRQISSGGGKDDKDGLFNVFHNKEKLKELKQKFKIDERKLQTQMRDLQRKLHPDKFMDTSGKTFNKSQELSSIINDLYTVLKHPYKRGKYLLSLILGKSQSEIESNLEKYKVDQEFLMLMMDLREQIEDREQSSETLYKLFSKIESDLIDMTNQLDEQFESKNIDNIYKMLAKLKFLANCHHSLAERLESFSKF